MLEWEMETSASWGFLANQTSLFGEFQASEGLCYKKKKKKKKTQKTNKQTNKKKTPKFLNNGSCPDL
jgi:hypothetical protein